MSHAEHFLQRLARLADDHVRLALDLYHDPAWVRTLLERAGLGEQVERVAISLADPSAGPFVIVTRGGDFVTCLGEGMSPGKWPVVSREKLDVAAAATARERDKQRLRGQLEAPDERVTSLFRRLLRAPDEISREDFVAAAAWEPLLGAAFLDVYRAMGATLVESGKVLRGSHIPRRHRDELLHEYWNLLHGAGHMALLGSMSADAEQRLAAYADIPDSDAAFSYPLVGTGVTTSMLKGSWAAGRVGKPLLAGYKRALGHDVAFFELLDTLLALLAIGRRSSKLRAEIAKAMRTAPQRAENDHARRLRAEMGHEVALVCEGAASFLETSEDELDDGLRRCGLAYFDGDVDVSDPEILDFADTLPLMSRLDGITDGRKLVRTMGFAAAAARLPAERFYLPRAVQDTLYAPWTPGDTLLLLEPIARAEGARKPARRAEPKVGRNDPCPCGSGQKHKRCCAKA